MLTLQKLVNEAYVISTTKNGSQHYTKPWVQEQKLLLQQILFLYN